MYRTQQQNAGLSQPANVRTDIKLLLKVSYNKKMSTEISALFHRKPIFWPYRIALAIRRRAHEIIATTTERLRLSSLSKIVGGSFANCGTTLITTLSVEKWTLPRYSFRGMHILNQLKRYLGSYYLSQFVYNRFT